jgi:hypothetical protein
LVIPVAEALGPQHSVAVDDRNGQARNVLLGHQLGDPLTVRRDHVRHHDVARTIARRGRRLRPDRQQGAGKSEGERDHPKAATPRV